MEKVIEHFGTGLLCGTAGVLFLAIFSEMLKDGGILKEFALHFMTDICG